MISLPRSTISVTALTLASAVSLALMPLSTAAAALGVSARHSHGSIISGALRDASVGAVWIGDVNAKLSFLPLLTGRFGFALHRGDAPYAPGISGTVGSSFGGIFVDKLSATIDGGVLVRGIDGSDIRFENLSFAFSGKRCKSASGTVRASLDNSALGEMFSGEMVGDAKCDKGDLYFQLLSQSTLERAAIRIKADGQYSVALALTEPSPEHADALVIAGFQTVPNGMRLLRSGKID